ncbi:hypothetical protein PRZ48_007921 [Zasmidium cellare]|uniref:ER-bound oxygenase mpaB/mpaB'/Rubber oxygenase catalytic domain-containing protein n=1 Tax=Zasmidium cellare TaxID=395010 RepID=A0ABR0EEL0_ZASCE|nr:hypothetical protein PRZ48_007921 [Zasmidium cellare]
MTNNGAHPIIRDLQQLDFPVAFEAGLSASLVRPFGLPSVSAVFAKTKQFANVDIASKRTADTACLVIDMSHYPPESERACAALSRTNYIHQQYQKAGLIKNDDLLHTLALLAWLPVRFIQRWEWRELDEAEIYAVGVYWKSIGDAMSISYEPMENFGTPGPAKDGIEFMEKLRVWSEQYEVDNMKAHPLNAKAVEETEVVLLYGMTGSFRHIGRKALSAAMDERMRNALMYPKPGLLIYGIVHGYLQLRLYLTYLALPRTEPHLRSTEQPDTFGRYFRTTWAAQPWYVQPTDKNRNGIKAWITQLRGLPLPGDAGLKSDGYKAEEIGPKRFEGKGLKEFEEEKALLMASNRGGCPFAR